MEVSTKIPRSLEDWEAYLTLNLGAVIGGPQLTRVLGYPSQGAFRQSLARGRVPVPVFAIEGRRGRYALATDIAGWIAGQLRAEPPTTSPESEDDS